MLQLKLLHEPPLRFPENLQQWFMGRGAGNAAGNSLERSQLLLSGPLFRHYGTGTGLVIWTRHRGMPAEQSHLTGVAALEICCLQASTISYPCMRSGHLFPSLPRLPHQPRIFRHRAQGARFGIWTSTCSFPCHSIHRMSLT